VPGESSLINGLAEYGMDIAHSPLLFQGGNLLAVRNPQTGERLLLIGESEIHRNTALGLTPDQTLQAFRIEFGVDRCEVLPAVSFHIDYDVSIRAHDGKLIAFVNEQSSAVRLIIECGIRALRSHELLSEFDAEAAMKHLNAGRTADLLQILNKVISANQPHHGHYPLSLAQRFSVRAEDSGVGNFQRFLLAIDWLTATSMPNSNVERDPNLRVYHDAIRDQQAARLQLHERLEQLGFALVPVPGMVDPTRGIVYVNGIHDSSRYIMPVYGGLYALLDEAAGKAFSQALGPQVEITTILSSESQRRSGGIHCSCSAYPQLGSRETR
jgi:hypothetical protein